MVVHYILSSTSLACASLTSFLLCRARPAGTRWRCGCGPSSNRISSHSATSSRSIPGRFSSSASSCSSASRWGSSLPGWSGASKSCGWKVSQESERSSGDRRENGQLGNFHSDSKTASSLFTINAEALIRTGGTDRLAVASAALSSSIISILG